jgi:hypothetical protein
MWLSCLFIVLVWGEVCTREGKIRYLDEKELSFPNPARSSSAKGTKVLTTREKGKIDTKRPTSHPRAPKQAEKEIRILEMNTTPPQITDNLSSPLPPHPPSQSNHLKSLLLPCSCLKCWLCYPARLPQKKLRSKRPRALQHTANSRVLR